MPKNVYPDLSIAELLPVRDRLREARNGGSLTSVGIEPRIANMFAAVPTSELNKRLEEVEWSLYLAAQAQNDPEIKALYQNPYCQKVMKVKVVHGPGYGIIGGLTPGGWA